MKREALTKKILLLGVDGMDPRLTRKYVDEGKMPNVKKYIEMGAQRHDLTMLGGHPTVTPPMWTTLATGANSNVHGITGFWRKGDEIGKLDYNMDSRHCKAEQLWNCFAEAGKKTLVWHWPGSSWPPTSDNENLMVVDGTSPGSVGMAVAQVDTEFLVDASTEIKEITYIPHAASGAVAACVITDLDLTKDESVCEDFAELMSTETRGMVHVVYKESLHGTNSTEDGLDLVQSPIKEAKGWINAPEGAKEFTILLSKGLIRRPALILKNEMGIYDRIEIYKSKKEIEPMAICPVGVMVSEVVDEAIKNDKKYNKVNRNFKLVKLDENGDNLTLYVASGMDMTNDTTWHPKRLFKEITENIGYPTPTSYVGCQSSLLITDCMLANWYVSADWQADSILHLIESEKLDIVFSHFHNIDLEGHKFVKHLADRPFNKQSVAVAKKWMEDIYVQADYYLGKFIHLLDEGWTILIFSDHGMVASKNTIPMTMDIDSITTPIMEELGYTVLKLDEEGNRIGEIDWTKTRAIIQGDGHLYLNIKGRDTHNVNGEIIDGIVDPTDQYQLEEQIMTDLYSVKSPETGHRIVSLALRNRDAVLLGQGGPEAGDIIIWNAEGYNYDHADCISTTLGEGETSVSPIFIAAGKGLKKGFETDRIIREVDLAATVAILGGVRMPAQCEGAPVYQIFEEEF